MKGFRFRLEKLRGLRSAEQQEKGRALAEARESLDKARGVVDRIARSESGIQDRMRAVLSEEPKAGVVQNMQVLLSALQRQRSTAEEARSLAEREFELASTEFENAYREREIMDRLRDRHRGRWVREEQQREQSVLDELGRGRERNLGDGAGS